LPWAGDEVGVIGPYIMRRAPLSAGRVRSASEPERARSSAPIAGVAAFAHDPPERGQRGAGADRGEHLQAAPEPVEVEHFPAFRGGDAPQALVGVDHDRVAN